MTLIEQPNTRAAVIARIRALQLPPPPERRRLRIAAGATLEDVAEAMGVSGVTASYWERGICMPRRRYRQKYLDLLEDFAAIEREKKSQK
jgi:DNA-binding XRE family transcriptional regulator